MISLRQLEQENGRVAYKLYSSGNADEAERDLLNFLHSGIYMSHLWMKFSASDERFSKLAQHLGGARAQIISVRDVIPLSVRREFCDVYITTELMDIDMHQIICSNQGLSEEHCQYPLPDPV